MKNQLGSRALLVGLLIIAASGAYAHGDGETMEMGSEEEAANLDMNTSETPPSTYTGPHTYFRHREHSSLIIWHIVILSIGWIVVLPIAVMFVIVRSRFRFAIQLTFLVFNVVGVLLGTVYNAQTPDLYPNNIHHKFGWFLTWLVCVQVGLAYLNTYRSKSELQKAGEESVNLIPVSTEAMVEHHRLHNLEQAREYRYSNDSGHGTAQNTPSLKSHSSSSTEDDFERPRYPLQSTPDMEEDTTEQDVFVAGGIRSKEPNSWVRAAISRGFFWMMIFYDFVNRAMLMLGFAILASGIVTYGGLFKGNEIFGGLAHFVKGAVFFWVGVLALGRWAGCFADRGWAWNIPSSSSRGWSAEFMESFLIFIYGVTNVFLEHLGSSDGAWSAEDLEHVSITILFFGGGLSGMLVESTKIRNLLNTTSSLKKAELSNASGGEVTDDSLYQNPKTYTSSMNPIPALVILLLGFMMSSHHQNSMFSTMIHKQWGSLLIGAGVVRGLSYVLIYLSPPKSMLPSRPPTELVTSFCLMAGGVVFMASSRDTVISMEMNGLNAMFVFTVAAGFISTLMAWILTVIAIGGWALRHTSQV